MFLTVVVSTLYKVENPTQDFVSFSTSDQVLKSLFLLILLKNGRETIKERQSTVCLSYCIYFVSFAKLKQCADWHKSLLSDGFTLNLLGLQLTYSYLRITLLRRTIIAFSRRFLKFLWSSANVSKLRKFREKTVFTANGNCQLDMFQ